MIAHKKEFYGGVGMMAAFTVVLVIIFSPIFNGQNGLDYLDALYNSISKGSAYYIPKVREAGSEFNGNNIKVAIGAPEDEPQALVLQYLSDQLQCGQNICDH